MRFPIQVVAKSRTPEEHVRYYRWVNFVTGREEYWHPATYRYRMRNIWGPRWGFRTRWFLAFMDCVPKVVWRRLPVRWQTAHLFSESWNE